MVDKAIVVREEIIFDKEKYILTDGIYRMVNSKAKWHWWDACKLEDITYIIDYLFSLNKK